MAAGSVYLSMSPGKDKGLSATPLNIHSWCLRYGLTVNAKKTGLIMLTGNVRWGRYMLPTLSGVGIQLV